jgi:hypothetical protein
MKPKNIIYVDFQLKLIQTRPVRVKPVMRINAEGNSESGQVIKIDFVNKKKVA